MYSTTQHTCVRGPLQSNVSGFYSYSDLRCVAARFVYSPVASHASIGSLTHQRHCVCLLTCSASEFYNASGIPLGAAADVHFVSVEPGNSSLSHFLKENNLTYSNYSVVNKQTDPGDVRPISHLKRLKRFGISHCRTTLC